MTSSARDAARRPTRFSPDVGREQVGEIYARCLLGAAEKAGEPPPCWQNSTRWWKMCWPPFPSWKRCSARRWSAMRRRSSLLDRVFSRGCPGCFSNFLKVVSRHGRLDCLRAIRHQARKLYEEMQGNVRVRITTAAAVAPEQVEQIAAALAASLGRRPILETVVDPALIGGAVLRIGDTVYDGSVANQLQSHSPADDR